MGRDGRGSLRKKDSSHRAGINLRTKSKGFKIIIERAMEEEEA